MPLSLADGFRLPHSMGRFGRILALLPVILAAVPAQAREVVDMAGRTVGVPEVAERPFGAAPPLTDLPPTAIEAPFRKADVPVWQANQAASLAVVNLFDRDYVGVARADYYQLLSGGSAIYYPGAPRTLVAKLSLDF